jgi:hypothetical protein
LANAPQVTALAGKDEEEVPSVLSLTEQLGSWGIDTNSGALLPQSRLHWLTKPCRQLLLALASLLSLPLRLPLITHDAT